MASSTLQKLKGAISLVDKTYAFAQASMVWAVTAAEHSQEEVSALEELQKLFGQNALKTIGINYPYIKVCVL